MIEKNMSKVGNEYDESVLRHVAATTYAGENNYVVFDRGLIGIHGTGAADTVRFSDLSDLAPSASCCSSLLAPL